MWNWFNCYLSGRHEFGVWCEPGAIFLRCVHCGKRSQGWELNATPKRSAGGAAAGASARARPDPPPRAPHVLPFGRSAAR